MLALVILSQDGTTIFNCNFNNVYLAYVLQIVINNRVLWVIGRFVLVEGLRANHYSVVTHGTLKIDVFEVFWRRHLEKKSSQIQRSFSH